MRRVVALGLGAAFLSLFLLAAPSMGQIQLAAHLTGADTVPPSGSPAIGEATLTLNTSTRTFTYRVVATCVAPQPCFTLKLHRGSPGTNGPEILTLNTFSSYTPVAPDLYEGTSPVLSEQELTDIFSGATYLAIASGQCLFGGLIDTMRGQVSVVIERRLTASLDGASAIPPTTSTATGTAHLTLNEAARSLAYDVGLSGTTATTLELRQAGPGGNGPVIASLTGGPTSFCGLVEGLTLTEVGQIRAGLTYLALTTATAPNGAIRGQVDEVAAYHFNAELTGWGVIPQVTTSARGFATATLDTATKVLTYQIAVTGLLGTDGQINAGFFHQPAIITGSYPGGPITWTGATPPLPGSVIDLLFRQGLHVTVCSSAYPGGEIRGQLAPNAYRYGFGSNTGSGIARIGYRGDHLLGSTDWTATVTGAPGGTPAWLFIGLANETFAGQPLPFDLQSGGVGQHRAFLWFDPTAGTIFVPAITDVGGCAAVPLALPNAPQFVGLRAFYQWYLPSGTTPAGFSVSDALRVVVQ